MADDFDYETHAKNAFKSVDPDTLHRMFRKTDITADDVRAYDQVSRRFAEFALAMMQEMKVTPIVVAASMEGVGSAIARDTICPCKGCVDTFDKVSRGAFESTHLRMRPPREGDPELMKLSDAVMMTEIVPWNEQPGPTPVQMAQATENGSQMDVAAGLAELFAGLFGGAANAGKNEPEAGPVREGDARSPASGESSPGPRGTEKFNPEEPV